MWVIQIAALNVEWREISSIFLFDVAVSDIGVTSKTKCWRFPLLSFVGGFP